MNKTTDNVVTTMGSMGTVLLEPKISFNGFADAVEKIYVSCEVCGLPLKRDQAYIYPGTIDAREKGYNELMHKHCYTRKVRTPLSASSAIGNHDRIK
jgi:hypothetical protein